MNRQTVGDLISKNLTFEFRGAPPIGGAFPATKGWASPHLCNPELKNVPPSTSPPDLAKPCCFERRSKAHEPIARRLWIDWICFHNRGTSGFGKVHGSGNDSLSDALATQPANHEETSD